MKKKVLLLDIENQPKKIKELLSLLQNYTQVILVYANANLSIGLDDLLALSTAIHEQRLLIIKMPKAGANSADFGLTFIAGRLSTQLEKGSCIDVMSNDNAMSYAVELLDQIGIQSTHIKHVLEHEKKSELVHTAEIKPLKIETKQSEVSDESVIQVLKLLQKNQPKKPKSLLKSLMSWCSFSKLQAEQMVQHLQFIAVISIHENKLQYAEKSIKKNLIKNKLISVSSAPDDKMTLAYIQPRPHLLRIKQYCDYLAKMVNSKPSKIETLSNSVKAVLKFENDAQIEHMLNLLKKHQILQIHETKVLYIQENIKIWSNLK